MFKFGYSYVLLLALALSPSVHARPLPAMSNYNPLIAKPPYCVTNNGSMECLRLGRANTSTDVLREFNFTRWLINPKTGYMDALSWQVPTPAGFETLIDVGYKNPTYMMGVPGRLELNNNILRIGYNEGDSPSGDKARAMLNTWQFSDQKKYLIKLSFKLGDKSYPWPLFAPGTAPVLIWQTKAEPSNPSMGMIVDTDQNNPGKFKIEFGVHLKDIGLDSWTVYADNLDPNQFNDVVMEVYPTSKDNGFWSIWVNGKYLTTYNGRTLVPGLPPHRWSFGAYMFNKNEVLPYDRVTFWRDASFFIQK